MLVSEQVLQVSESGVLDRERSAGLFFAQRREELINRLPFRLSCGGWEKSSTPNGDFAYPDAGCKRFLLTLFDRNNMVVKSG